MGTMRFLKQQVVKEETNTESPARKIKLYLKIVQFRRLNTNFNLVEYKYFYTFNNNFCILWPLSKVDYFPSLYKKI